MSDPFEWAKKTMARRIVESRAMSIMLIQSGHMTLEEWSGLQKAEEDKLRGKTHKQVLEMVLKPESTERQA